MVYSKQEFKQFYLDTFSGLKTYILAKCGDISLAEDISQDAYIRFWNSGNKIEKNSAKSYLFTTANNLFLDYVRHEKVKKTYTASFLTLTEIKDPQYLIEMEEFRVLLDATIQKMPENSREVFLLNRMEKMTYQQIADSLGLSVKAIEKRMQKALEILSELKIVIKK